MKSDLVDIDVEKLHETQRAVLVTTGRPDDAVWLPLAQVEIVPHDSTPGLHTVTMPEWLALDRGLI